MHDGSITFSTALDNKQLEKDLAGLIKKIEKAEQKVADLSSKIDAAKKKSLFDGAKLDAEKAKLQEIKDRLVDIRAMAKDKSLSLEDRERAKALIPSVQEELKDQQKRVNALQSEWNKTENAVDRYTAQLSEAGAALNRQKSEAGYIQQQINEAEQTRAEILASAKVADQHIIDLNRELEELKSKQEELRQAGVGLGFQEYDAAAARIAEITRELKEYQKTLNGAEAAAERASERIGSVAKNLAAVGSGETSTGSNALGTAIDSIAKKMLSVFGGLGKPVAAVKQFGKAAVRAFTQAALAAVKLLDKVNVFPKMFSSIGKSLKKLGQMIRRVFVFSVITSGLRAIRTQMMAYLTINAEFSSSLGRLKGVLLTAFQPIYDVAVPALTVLMNLLARAIAAIAQFTAVLFGTTAKQAQKNAQALYKQAKATTAAGDAAKEAAGSLAGFDEINTIQTEAGGGSGSASAEIGPLFDWEYEDTPFPDWGEAFDALLDKMLGSIPRLKDALKDFAHWFNDLTRKAYDMFTFPGVLEKVEQLGRDLAGTFNGLVVQIDWYQLGQAMGAGLNFALQFLTEFIYTFDWITLGMALAAMINGLAAQVDWYDFGRLLWSGFKIGLETLAGFLLGLDMPLLAEAASKTVMGFFDEMKATLDRINWREIGEKIRYFLENIQWAEIADSVFGAIRSAFTASSDFFSGLLGDELKRTLTDMLIEISKYTLVIGAILALTGANVPLGLGLMKVGAASLAAAAVLDWEYVASNISQIVSEIAGVLGGALLVIGAVLTLSGPQHIPLGIGLMAAGAASLATAMAINWDFIPITISGVVTAALIILSAALLVIGAILALSGPQHLPLGIGLMALGAVSLASAAAINWDILPNTIGGLISKVTAIVSAALLVLGIILACSGVALPLGIALIAAGAVGLVSVGALNWDAILEKLKGVWDGIKNWWNSSVKKFFTLDYWKNKGREIIDGFLKGIQDAWNGLKSWFSNAWDSLFGNRTVSVNTNVSGAAAGASIAVGRNSVRAASMPQISTAQIPALAQGAVIPPNREFMAVLGDQTSGNNLEAPESLIRKIVREEAGGNNTALLEDILEAIKAGHIIMVDRRILGRTVTQEQNKMTRQAGRSVVLG